MYLQQYLGNGLDIYMPSFSSIGNGGASRAYGVRIILTLNPNIKFKKSKDSITLSKMDDGDTTRGGPYTYNVWEIQ